MQELRGKGGDKEREREREKIRGKRAKKKWEIKRERSMCNVYGKEKDTQHTTQTQTHSVEKHKVWP